MKRIKVRQFVGFWVLASATVLLFQNCGNGFQALEGTSTSLQSLSQASGSGFSVNSMPPFVSLKQFALNFSDELAANSQVKQVTCQLNQVEPADCTSGVFNVTGAAEGLNQVKIFLEDSSGQKTLLKTVSFTVDQTPPVVQLTKPIAAETGSKDFSFTFSANDNLTSAGEVVTECSYDNAAFKPCVSPNQITGMTEGPHTFRIRAMDKAGNVGPIVSNQWVTNLNVPTAAIAVGPAGAVNVRSVSFEFQGAEQSTALTQFECRLDSADFVACPAKMTFENLSDGEHSVELVAIDSAGKRSSAAKQTFRVDTQPPAAPKITSNMTNVSQSSFVFTFATAATGGSGIASFECSLDNGSFAPCTSPATFSPTEIGQHVLNVRAVDDAGNRSAPVTYSWATSDVQIQITDAVVIQGDVLKFQIRRDKVEARAISFDVQLDAGPPEPRLIEGPLYTDHTHVEPGVNDEYQNPYAFHQISVKPVTFRVVLPAGAALVNVFLNSTAGFYRPVNGIIKLQLTAPTENITKFTGVGTIVHREKAAYRQIAPSGYHVCAITSTKTVQCWGENGVGQLGNGLPPPPAVDKFKRPTLPPQNVVGLTDVVQLAVGTSHSCALTGAKKVFCWGGNSRGSLGIGVLSSGSPIPVEVLGLNEDVVQISAGYDSTCALLASGTMKCWGESNGPSPHLVLDPKVGGTFTDIVQISKGFNHFCVLVKNGKVRCWGGYPAETNGTADSDGYVAGLSGVKQVAVGYDHSCALLLNGTVKCWGVNSAGALGIPTSTAKSAVPVDIAGLTGIQQIAASISSTVALDANGAVYTWGSARAGQSDVPPHKAALFDAPAVGISADPAGDAIYMWTSDGFSKGGESLDLTNAADHWLLKF